MINVCGGQCLQLQELALHGVVERRALAGALVQGLARVNIGVALLV